MVRVYIVDIVNPPIPRTPLENWIKRKIGGKTGFLNRSDLESYQLEKLQYTLNLAKEKSLFFQQKLKDYSACLQNFENWQKLPFTTAEELTKNSLQMVTVSQGDIHRVVTLTTSGTSGIPKRCLFTKKDQELTIDFFGIGMTSLTSKKDKVLILLPCERPGSVGDLLFLGLKQQKIESIKYGAVEDISVVMKLVKEQKITAMVGAPKQILGLARWAPVLGFSIPRTLRSVLLSTDHLPLAISRSLENTWGCSVFNHYGMTEMGLGGGVDCQAHYGMHLREADLFFEIINPETGQVLPDGESGEVVFTTLTREGMPLIRYRTGDVSRFLPGPCLCGSTLKTLDWVRYRYTNILHWDNSELTLADLDEVLFAIPQVLDFCVEVYRKNKIELSFCVYVNQPDLKLEHIRSRLLTIEPLEKSIQTGKIIMNLEMKYGLPENFSSLAKRKIHFVNN